MSAPPHSKPYYKCASRHTTQKLLPLEERCKGKTLRADVLEDQVWAAVVRQVSDPELIIGTLRAREAERSHERRAEDAQLITLEEVEQALKREGAKLLDLHMSDVIDRDTLQERMALIKQKREANSRAKAELLARIAQRDRVSANEDVIHDMAARAQRGLLRYLTWEDKREFLEAVELRLESHGDHVIMTGLITPTVLNLVEKGNRPALTSSEDADLLCTATPQWPFPRAEHVALTLSLATSISNNRTTCLRAVYDGYEQLRCELHHALARTARPRRHRGLRDRDRAHLVP